MPDLIAQGVLTQQRWRRRLPTDQVVVLGRGSAGFAVDWDDRISRQHAELRWRDGRLQVRKLDSARNPIFARGAEVEQCELLPGEHFVIGQTSFTLVEQRVDVSAGAPLPLEQRTFSAQYLQQLPFHNARARIEVLGRLPDVIAGAGSETELFVRLINLLLTGIPTADAVALVRVDADRDAGAPIDVLHWDRRLISGGPFEPSERLIRDAVARGESILHLWSGRSESQFTAHQDTDWAFCTPVSGEASRGWAIYVAGRFAPDDDRLSPSDPTDPNNLRDDLKFTEVAAATLRSLHELRLLQRQHAGLSQFFSPIVLDALAQGDAEEALRPRETEVTVLFCDLRGFSRQSERSADDLLGLLDRVSKALGVTTHHILAQGGVVGDFQGDAVMGFWGWPLVQPDAIERACTAALAIGSELERAARQEQDPLAGFRLGLGIATGNAVAGKIGTVDQVKVTVFGPVVNLASRLESMTKTFRAPIQLDERTARHVCEHLPRTLARCRRLAVVKPYGMETPVEISELLLPAAQHPLQDADLAQYESALTAFQAGRWDEAFERLHRVPAEDRVKDFLTVLIAQHNRTAPDGWNGVIELSSK